MTLSRIPERYNISPDEILSVKDYIRRKNTAVLTTMFTDIEGFTTITETRGEQYSAELRKQHDKIVVETIEEGGAGLVIKFIGDAVMAVFSEPSAAVERSLLIQKRIHEFNETDHEFEPLSVRIGLHMGQVAIEENIQADVFGRHVNRAARIESMAAGGQIFMSYTVFDSAKGWLEAHKELVWTLHGAYYLKGIDKPVEIYEVCDPAISNPRPPARGRRQRAFPKLAASIGLVGIGAIIAVTAILYEKTEVWLVGIDPEGMFLDAGERVILEGESEAAERKLVAKLGAGNHVLYWDFNESLRYYAPIEVERGKNVLQPEFEEGRLPIFSVRNGVRDQPANSATGNRAFSYSVFTPDGQKLEHTAELSITIDSARDSVDPDRVTHQFKWKITADGNVLDEGSTHAEHRVSADRSNRVMPVPLVVGEQYFFYYEYYMSHEFAEFSLGAKFNEYLDGAE